MSQSIACNCLKASYAHDEAKPFSIASSGKKKGHSMKLWLWRSEWKSGIIFALWRVVQDTQRGGGISIPESFQDLTKQNSG